MELRGILTLMRKKRPVSMDGTIVIAAVGENMQGRQVSCTSKGVANDYLFN